MLAETKKRQRAEIMLKVPNRYVCLGLLLLLAFLNLTSRVHASSVSVQLTEKPKDLIWGISMVARMNGGDDNDPTPNYCYGIRGCAIRLFIVDGRWPGKKKYGTGSSLMPTHHYEARLGCGSSGRTLGEVIKCLRSKNFLYTTDTLVIAYSGVPADHVEVCAFLTDSPQQTNESQGPLGPCAKNFVVPTSCSMSGGLSLAVRGSPSQINNAVGLPTFTGTGSVKCSGDVEGWIRIASSSGSIPLDNGGVCAVDFGSGPGKAHRARVRRGIPYNVQARCKFSDVTAPGVHSASAVVLFSID